jgi:hypothetical protein
MGKNKIEQTRQASGCSQIVELSEVGEILPSLLKKRIFKKTVFDKHSDAIIGFTNHDEVNSVRALHCSERKDT